MIRNRKCEVCFDTYQIDNEEIVDHEELCPKCKKELQEKLAEYFDCSVYFLLFGEEDPKSLIGEILEKTEIHTGMYETSIKKVKTKGGTHDN